MAPDRRPFRSIEDLQALDWDECSEGYSEGLAGGYCDDTRSRSWWHGWMNGLVDSGLIAKTDDMAALVKDYRAHLKGRPARLH